jgi:hypothetical protein
MNRRLITFLIALAMCLQGPIVAYAATLGAVGTSITMHADCCPVHGCDHLTDGSCSCPAGVLAGGCASADIGTAILYSHVSLAAPAFHRLPWGSSSVSYATERPGP